MSFLRLISPAVNKWSCLRFPTVLISQLEEERASCMQLRMTRYSLNLSLLISLCGACALCYQTCKIISACAVNRWLLTCIQHTRRLIRVQHTKHYSHAPYHHAAHELLLVCNTQKITCVQYTKFDSLATHFVSHACFDLSHDKN